MVSRTQSIKPHETAPSPPSTLAAPPTQRSRLTAIERIANTEIGAE